MRSHYQDSKTSQLVGKWHETLRIISIKYGPAFLTLKKKSDVEIQNG